MIKILSALEIPLPPGVEPRTTLVLFLDVNGKPWVVAGLDPSLSKTKVADFLKANESDIARQSADQTPSPQYPLTRSDLIPPQYVTPAQAGVYLE